MFKHWGTVVVVIKFLLIFFQLTLVKYCMCFQDKPAATGESEEGVTGLMTDSDKLYDVSHTCRLLVYSKTCLKQTSR